MIIVLDTNVIISVLLSPSGPPAETVRQWEAEAFVVATSAPLLSELRRVLGYPRVARHLPMSESEATTLVHRLSGIATVVEPGLKLAEVEDDPADDRVLECAVAAGASYIVTGDVHLLRLKDYRGIVILPPAGFAALLARGLTL